MQLYILFGIGFGLLGWLLFSSRLKEIKRFKVKRQPFKKSWRSILKHRVPYFKYMPADLQLQLKRHIQVFLSEKEFIGCEGVQITDEIKITIAAQACMLILNRKTDYYPQLKHIYVYPSAFIKTQVKKDFAGVAHQSQSVLLGESWDLGKVVLSWNDTIEGADNPFDGKNVVFHEFAHQLDQESGNANGAPLLAKNIDYKEWSTTLNDSFNHLKYQKHTNKQGLFDYYGAENPAEFFAVASEVFFEQSALFAQHYPKMYQLFRRYYHIDPLTWH